MTKIKTFDTEQPFIIFTVATATRILSKGLQYLTHASRRKSEFRTHIRNLCCNLRLQEAVGIVIDQLDNPVMEFRIGVAHATALHHFSFCE